VKDIAFKAFDIPAAWLRAMQEIHTQGDMQHITDGSEVSWMKKLSVHIEITNPSNRPILDNLAPNDLSYTREYALRYLWTSSRIKGKEHYTYGSRLREPIDQLEHIMTRIIDNPKTRQLVATIRIPTDILKVPPPELEEILGPDGKVAKWEPPCMTILDFEVEGDLIHLHTYFRSWDCYGGFPINCAGLLLMMEGMCNEINERSGSSYQMGEMICNSKNLHFYKRQFGFIEQIFKRDPDTRRLFKNV
jgi:thymidylate synthase